MVEIMPIVLLKATKTIFFVAYFIAISANEIMAIDNTQWIYVVQGWKKISSSFIEIIGMFSISNNIFL
jgi:hypothetical protein